MARTLLLSIRARRQERGRKQMAIPIYISFTCKPRSVPTAMAMLKITTVKTNRQCRIVVEGELVSSGVEELKREWDGARVSAGCLTLVVDLRNVITIGQEGKDVLLEMMSEGVRFICGGVHNRHVLQQLERKINL